MLGAIIGDIVGSRYELRADRPKKDFELFTDECNFTHDTVCNVAIADAILNNRPYRETLHDWCSRYPDRMCDTGTAMCVSPVAWLFNDYHEVLEQSKLCAEISHSGADGISGDQCVATLIYWLRTCRITKSEIEYAVRRNFGYDIPSLKSSCQETIPWAIRCFLESENYEDALHIAVKANGNTGTAAICGSIAEAYYEIPENMIERAYEYLPEEMLTVIEQFYDSMQTEIGK